MKLVIVESPTKAKTLTRYLGDDYQVEATMGHIRDLPKGKIGIDVDHDFKPDYEIPKGKEKQVEKLKKLLKGKKEAILATDLDREGEAIAWHTSELLKNGLTFKRIIFHEITKNAILQALEQPREIDMNLVHAQQARRVLDRLVGYKLSPLLWYKTGKNWLSAGRVQSVALRLIVEREREIAAFVAEEFWEIAVALSKDKGEQFLAKLAKENGKNITISNQTEADQLVAFLEKSTYKVTVVEPKITEKSPPPPFITSTMQRAGANLFGWPARKTMTLAQNLYEKGLITYHRTDSVQLSQEALTKARDYIKTEFGAAFLPDQARIYRTKSKMAQEAHEAIRPTSLRRSRESLEQKAGRDHLKLYELISKRFLASQMKNAEIEVNKVSIFASAEKRELELQARGERVKFWGFMKLEANFKEQVLPKLEVGERLKLEKVLPEQKFTQPRARYNEASLIKALEDQGIGRPSTYAPIISTIQARQYVEKEDRSFKPTPLGIAINDFLVEKFADIINVEFTAKMEDSLDEIAAGREKWTESLSGFWGPFAAKVDRVKTDNSKVKVEAEETGEACPQDGGELVIRMGRFGKFVACANFPKCKFTKPLVTKVDIKCPKCHGDVVLKKTKKGRKFFGCSNYPKCDFASWKKPPAAAESS